MAHLSPEAFFNGLLDQFEYLQRSPHPLDKRRWCSLLNKLSCLYSYTDPAIPDTLYKDPSTGLYKFKGV